MIYAYDKDGIYFATDIFDLADYRYYLNPTEDNLPVWHPHENMLIYVDCTVARITDLIRYNVEVPKTLTPATVHDFYEEVRELIISNGYTNNKAYSLFISIADGQEIFLISKLGIISHGDRRQPIGGDNDRVLTLTLSPDLSPVEAIKEYYRNANEHTHRANKPFLLANTAEEGVKLVEL